ncbi:MAG: RpiB/LacA/LacB family sugar-phosphate isomerase [Clostridium sp.]|uniref:RpiB/LacA/LacB family sugar-phosphate isomerase n=1 Tax=Eisenbergiella porci TaxID=2652274 RepID=UPI00290C7185|nr:RpiB/LacA/LacB family sugar-phosphate isomerase [Clostridium sp.]
MRIAVINEFSTKNRNGDVLKALEELGYEPVNLGMKDLEGEPQLNYLETAFLSALALNLKAVDFVVGGCGTGQGYMNALLQYPGTFCGLLTDPTDAFLYSRINAGNCVSLPLNKGYGGVGGDINLKYIFEKLFNDTYGGGYPETRKEFQADLRKILNNLSLNAHKSMEEIVDTMDEIILKKALLFPGIRDMIEEAPESVLKKKIKEWYEKQ